MTQREQAGLALVVLGALAAAVGAGMALGLAGTLVVLGAAAFILGVLLSS